MLIMGCIDILCSGDFFVEKHSFNLRYMLLYIRGMRLKISLQSILAAADLSAIHTSDSNYHRRET